MVRSTLRSAISAIPVNSGPATAKPKVAHPPAPSVADKRPSMRSKACRCGINGERIWGLPDQPQPRRGRYGARGRRGRGGCIGAVVVAVDPGLTRPTWWETGRGSVLVGEAVQVPRVTWPVVCHRARAILPLHLSDDHPSPTHNRRRAVDGCGRTTATRIDDRHEHLPALASVRVGSVRLLHHEFGRGGVLRRERSRTVTVQPVDVIVQLAVIDRNVIPRGQRG